MDISKCRQWSCIPFLRADSSIELTVEQQAAFNSGLIPDDENPELLKVFAEPRILRVSDAQITSLCPGVYFRDGRLLDLGMGWSQGYKRIKTEILGQRKSVKNLTLNCAVKKIRGNYLDLNPLYGSEFYHAIYDVAYQIFAYEKIFGLPWRELDGVIVPRGFQHEMLYKELIESLLPSQINLLEAPAVDTSIVFQIESLITFSWSRCYLDQFRSYLINSLNITENKAPDQKTFCVRSKKTTNSDARVMLQNELVVDVFRESKFEIIDLAEFDFFQQLQFVNDSHLLAGVHGGALSHILFLHNDAGVIELLGPKHINNCYYHIAHGLNLNYFPVIDKRLDVEAAFSDKLRDADLLFDISALTAQVQWIVGDICG